MDTVSTTGLDEMVGAFARDGFVLGAPLLSEDEADELNEEVLRVIADQDVPGRPQPVSVTNLSRDGAEIWQIVNIWQASEAFERLVRHPVLAATAAALLGAKELRVWHDQIQYKPPRIGGVNMWHQDSPYWPTIGTKDQQITAWVALDAADGDNGAMSMVPGSHRWGDQIDLLHTFASFDDLPADVQGDPVEARLCPVPKGSVHFHHCLTWHGSAGNPSGRPRRAIGIHYMSERTVRSSEPAEHHPMTRFATAAPGERLEGGPFILVHPQAGA